LAFLTELLEFGAGQVHAAEKLTIMADKLSPDFAATSVSGAILGASRGVSR
jgi:hypothetical protein